MAKHRKLGYLKSSDYKRQDLTSNPSFHPYLYNLRQSNNCPRANMPSQELLPPRRVVTGHTDTGKSIIHSDQTFQPFHPSSALEKQAGVAFSLLWHSNSSPAINQGPWEELHGQDIPYENKHGTILRVADVAPGFSTPMHRTISLDYGVVLAGELVLEMEGGVEVTLSPGDVVVQRGTVHAWHNKSNAITRILFVLIASEPVVIGGRKFESI